jgi:phosphoserine phosphatase RsbU/P
LLERLTSLLGVDSAQILLPAKDGQSLTMRASKGAPRIEHVVVPPGTGVAGRVAATSAPVVVRHREQAGLETGDVASLLAVPLLVEGKSTGVLQVGSVQEDGFDEADVLLLQLAADRMAVAIERARLYERQHRIAIELQRSLLQADLPVVEGAQIAVRYLPGGSDLAVGGDWYDVVSLGDGRTGMAIGDVAGRGTRAAAVMGQLRNAFRAYAVEGDTPAEVLTRLNRFAGELELTNFSTVLYLVFDARSGEVTMANGGHLPPLLIEREGTARLIAPPEPLPLVVLSEAEFVDKRFRLESGSSILLYTDGLVEDPAVAIDRGLDRLVECVTGATQDPEDLCDRVMAAMFAGERADDVAVMALKAT